MFKSNKSKMAILSALGSLSTFSGPIFATGDQTINSVVRSNENNEDVSLIDLDNETDKLYSKLKESVSDCEKFRSKFLAVYVEKLNGAVSEDFYEGVVSKGKALCEDCIYINKSLLTLIKKCKSKLTFEINSARKELLGDSNVNKIEVMHKLSVLLSTKQSILSLENQVSSNLFYLDHWLLFADGKFDCPPFEAGDALLSYEDIRSIENEYELSGFTLDNVANNLSYVRQAFLDYYYDVKNGSVKFDSSIWRAILQEGESLLPLSIKLNEKFLDAYCKKYESIKSDKNSQELANGVCKMIEHFKFNLKWLNTWKCYISTNKDAQFLPDPIKEF